MLTPGTNRQDPNQAIMDHFDKQTYLGNQFMLSDAGFALGNTNENPMLLIQNPTVPASAFPSGYKSLFVNLRRVSSYANPALFKFYVAPTFASHGAQTVVTVADSSGSLNNTYFLLNAPGGAGYYVWYNINSAGTDPAVAGRTGIEVDAATSATNSQIAIATRTAINTAAPLVFSVPAIAGHTVTINNVASGPFTAAVDSSSATGFTFAVTAGVGTLLTPTNMRPLNANTSISVCSLGPTVSANGTLIGSLGAPATIASIMASELVILDPGQSLLVTAKCQASTATANADVGFYEI